jgi:hypothetical protein
MLNNTKYKVAFLQMQNPFLLFFIKMLEKYKKIWQIIMMLILIIANIKKMSELAL